MASISFERPDLHHPTVLDRWGYGIHPHPGTRMSYWLVGIAVAYYMGIQPILWRHALFIPSIVWTAVGTCLLWFAAITARRSSTSLPVTTWSTLIFLVCYPIFGWISYQVWGQISSEREALLAHTLLLMPLAMALYLVGSAVRSHRQDLGIGLAWIVTAAYVLLNANSFDTLSLYQATQESGVRLNYQLMGDAFAITSVILTTRLPKPVHRWLFAAASLAVMFIIPSRSAAFFGACSLLLALVLKGRGPTRLWPVALVIIALAGVQSGLLAPLFEGTRFESAFSDNSADTSWDSRQMVMKYGQELLLAKPFTGEWAFQLTDLGYSGAYIHSALDIWAQTGIIPFLIFITIWASLLYSLFEGWKRWPQIAQEAAPVLLFAAMSWALSRNVGVVVLFFCLGYASATLAQARFSLPSR